MATTKYAVYNPLTGTNEMYDNLDDAVHGFWTTMINFSSPFFHNTSYMVVQQNDDGSEIWYNDQNQEMQRPRTEQEIMEEIRLARAAVPSVVTLPEDPNA